MQRKEFLRSLTAIGFGSLLSSAPESQLHAKTKRQETVAISDCVLIPSETRGPYPLDLSQDSSKFRRAIHEDKAGVALSVTLTIVNVNDNCKPIPNVRVDVWHCDKDGVYSGFNQPGANTEGQTFCRGIQMSDALGQVTFTTIYPGWYNGRITHIHFEMFLSSILSASSQLCFPDALNTEVYSTALYASRGKNTSVANNAADSVFSDSTKYQLVNITPNAQTGGYDATLRVGIAVPISGVSQLEPECGGQFRLLQNSPNPFHSTTSIPFVLVNPAHVLIELFDMQGRKIAILLDGYREPGTHEVELNTNDSSFALTDSCYVYQLSTTNSYGTFRQSKVMTRG